MKGRPKRRLHPLASQEDAAAAVAAEIDEHFEGTVELLVLAGYSEDEARAEASRRFGDEARYRARLTAMACRRHRRERGAIALRAAGASLRVAAKDVRRAPGLALAIVVTLALGIGANAAVFRVVDRLLLSAPEHVARPADVRRLYQMMARENGEPFFLRTFTPPDVRAIRGALPGHRVSAATTGRLETLGDGENAQRVRVARVDSAFFPLVEVVPELGRAFAPDDHRPGATPVAILGHDLWVSLGSDPEIIGDELRVGSQRFEVLGVMPNGFVGAEPPAVDVWLPLESAAIALWGDDWASMQNVLALSVFTRVPIGGSVETVLSGASAALQNRVNYGVRGDLAGIGSSSLVPGDSPEPGAIVSVSRWLAGVSVLVLLVACANVASLLLVRAERRRAETAVRLALGASRARIALEATVHTLVLAVFGGLAAIGASEWGGGLLEGLFLTGMELEAPRDVGRLVVFVAVASLGAALVSGLPPALGAARAATRANLARGAGTTTSAGHARRVLVGVQAGLSSVLVVGALLFVSSLRAALDVDLGFDQERVLMVRIEGEEGSASSDRYAAAERTIRQLPEVESVAASVAVPFQTLYGVRAGRPAGEGLSPEEAQVSTNRVGEDYFVTMGVPIVRGRPVERSDREPGAAPVAVVSTASAARLWPGEDPIGKCLVLSGAEDSCSSIVGVAAGHAGTRLSLDAQRASETALLAWAPLVEGGSRAPSSLLVRPRRRADAAVESIRRAVLRAPEARYVEIAPLADFVDRQLRSWRLGAAILTLFAFLGVSVASVGLYAVLAYDVARRRREIGVRLALGAQPRRVLLRVLLGAVGTVLVGLAAALPLAMWGGSRVRSLLFDVSASDPAVFLFTAVILLVTGVLAATVPAWRATRVDPREALAEG